MGAVGLEHITLTPLKRIATPGGDVMHAMKRNDQGFMGFGEAYFSWIESDAVKAWKMHEFMTLNLVVPLGKVRFVFIQSMRSKKFRVEEIGNENYARITVPPGIWFGFKGIASPHSLVLNLADLPHDPTEVLRAAAFDIDYVW